MTDPRLFLFLDHGQELIIFSNGCLDLCVNVGVSYIALVPAGK